MNHENASTFTQWDQTVDVLVIGSGFAGLSAAIEASEEDLSMMVIEKMHSYGGNSIISDGGIAAPGTDLQKKRGIEDSPDIMYEDMIEAGLGLNHPKLLRTVVDQALEAFSWTLDPLGVPYLDRVDLFGGHRLARCYTPEGITGATILKKMMALLKKRGITPRYRTFLQSLVVDEEGTVVGAKVLTEYDYKTGDGQVTWIRARRGVILATGGYGADVPFRSLQDPRLDASIQTTNKPFATAEGLRSALSVGAASVQLSQIQLGAWASPDEKGFGHGPLFADYILFQYGLIVDPETGCRFVNELGDRKRVADALLKIGHPCIGIADAGAVERSGWDLSKAMKKGVVVTYPSIEAVARAHEIDPSVLEETMETYNRSVIGGKDEAFDKPIVDDAQPITEPPFYVMRLWPKVHFTMGGLAINERAQVLSTLGQVIPGLYAAGEVAGGVHGASRLGSCAITECIVFGRIAGRESRNHKK